MEEQLQAEVPLFVLVVLGPTKVPVTTIFSIPHLPASFVPVLVPVAQKILSDSSLREMQEWVSVLYKPYPGALVIIPKGVPGGVVILAAGKPKIKLQAVSLLKFQWKQ